MQICTKNDVFCQISENEADILEGTFFSQLDGFTQHGNCQSPSSILDTKCGNVRVNAQFRPPSSPSRLLPSSMPQNPSTHTMVQAARNLKSTPLNTITQRRCWSQQWLKPCFLSSVHDRTRLSCFVFSAKRVFLCSFQSCLDRTMVVTSQAWMWKTCSNILIRGMLVGLRFCSPFCKQLQGRLTVFLFAHGISLAAAVSGFRLPTSCSGWPNQRDRVRCIGTSQEEIWHISVMLPVVVTPTHHLGP